LDIPPERGILGHRYEVGRNFPNAAMNAILKSGLKQVFYPIWRIKLLRYPSVLLGILAGGLVLLLLADRVIMPGIVHWGEATVVPDLTDLSLKEAEAALKKEGLSLQLLAEEHDATRPPGTVLSQIPGPNTRIREGRSVRITVSKGGKMVLVPGLEGVSIRQAELMLAHEGLELGDISWVASDSFPENVVIATTPSAETSVPFGMFINLKVSLGVKPASVEVPYLVGMNLEEGKKILREIGLELGKIKSTLNNDLLPGTVLNQSLAPGQEIERGSKINLEVSTTE
jgi:beta-lactam-binding protein with PASTA domain